MSGNVAQTKSAYIQIIHVNNIYICKYTILQAQQVEQDLRINKILKINNDPFNTLIFIGQQIKIFKIY